MFDLSPSPLLMAISTEMARFMGPAPLSDRYSMASLRHASRLISTAGRSCRTMRSLAGGFEIRAVKLTRTNASADVQTVASVSGFFFELLIVFGFENGVFVFLDRDLVMTFIGSLEVENRFRWMFDRVIDGFLLQYLSN